MSFNSNGNQSYDIAEPDTLSENNEDSRMSFEATHKPPVEPSPPPINFFDDFGENTSTFISQSNSALFDPTRLTMVLNQYQQSGENTTTANKGHHRTLSEPKTATTNEDFNSSAIPESGSSSSLATHPFHQTIEKVREEEELDEDNSTRGAQRRRTSSSSNVTLLAEALEQQSVQNASTPQHISRPPLPQIQHIVTSGNTSYGIPLTTTTTTTAATTTTAKPAFHQVPLTQQQCTGVDLFYFKNGTPLAVTSPQETSLLRISSDDSKYDDGKKNYKCSRCGEIKANHICKYVKHDFVAIGLQADPTEFIQTKGQITITVRPRSFPSALPGTSHTPPACSFIKF